MKKHKLLIDTFNKYKHMDKILEDNSSNTFETKIISDLWIAIRQSFIELEIQNTITK